MSSDGEESEYEISREELREILDEVRSQGVEQLQRNPRDERPYLYGQGTGIMNAAGYISRHFDLEDFDDE